MKNGSDRSWTYRRLRRFCSASLGEPGRLRLFLTLLKRNYVPELDTATAYNGSECGRGLGAVTEAQHHFLITTKVPGLTPSSLNYNEDINP